MVKLVLLAAFDIIEPPWNWEYIFFFYKHKAYEHIEAENVQLSIF